MTNQHKFEVTKAQTDYFRMYEHTVIVGTAILTANPVVIQMLDGMGFQPSALTEYDKIVLELACE